MPEFVVVLETTGPDGEPWEQVVSPRFSSEVEAAAWRKENKLPHHCRIRPVDGIADEAKALLTGPVQESLKQKWQDGDAQALLEAVQRYGYCREPLPLWCWTAFHQAALKLSMYQVRDLNEAFGFDPKGRGRLPDRNRKARLEWKVFILCRELCKPGRGVSKAIFEEVSQIMTDDYGEKDVGKTTVEDYYYSVLKKIEALR